MEGQVAAAGSDAGRRYDEARKHGTQVGVPHLHVAASIVDALCLQYQSNAPQLDAPNKKRWEVLLEVQSCIATHSQEDLDEFIKTFMIDPMRQQEGKPQRSRLTFCATGAVRLGPDQGLDDRIAAKVASDPKDRNLSTFHFVELQVVPGNGDGAVVGLQGLFRSSLCANGATRWTGRKPRGGLAWRNKKGE